MSTADPINSASNQLPTGVTLEAVAAAVEHSGYPLQIAVAAQFDASYQIKQEWAYIDRDSGSFRTLDLFVRRDVAQRPDDTRLHPRLLALIECKKSEQPFVFFLTKSAIDVPNLPLIVGLHACEIELAASPQSCRFGYSICESLSMVDHPFINYPNYCFTFSKLRWHNKRLELSGSEAYNTLTLPLIKALTYLPTSREPKSTFTYFEFGMGVAIAIIDGPMVAVREGQFEMLPWVRVFRYENDLAARIPGSDKLYAIDVVHKDFFETYRDDHLLPYLEEFAERALRHQKEIISGEATLSEFEIKPSEMEKYLRPRPVEWVAEDFAPEPAER